LLAVAYFKSGQKNDAADAASGVLKRYPYCLDANRVLTEMLGSDRPDSARAYLQRVVELDPYAAHVDESVFLSNKVSDAAVTLERLEWNGEQTGMASDWRSAQAISLEGTSSDEQPAWLKDSSPETESASQPAPTFAPEQDTVPAPEASTPAQPSDDIPDFLRAAGWGESTGAYDESASSAMFDDEPATSAQPLEEGDMPDWVKAMAPKQEETPEPAAEDDLPDWIKSIGTGQLRGAAEDQPDWLSQIDETPKPETESADDQPEWLKGMGQDDEQPAPASTTEPDWLNHLGSDIHPEEKTAVPDTGNLGMAKQEQDDSFAWLENLAAKQGATEGLLTKPEDRLESEPDWVKQAKEMAETPSQPLAEEPEEQPVPAVPVQTETPTANLEDLGKSEEERDDSFAWLENLAAKQGATEGLLTKSEERPEEEPEWVKQAKNAGTDHQPSAQKSAEELSPPITQKLTDTGDLGKSEEERDDSFAWLENLAAKQGATEGLLTKPEDRREDEPEWVKQAKLAGESPAAQPSMPVEEPEKAEAETTTEAAAPVEDIAAWLEGLDKDEPVEEAQSAPVDDTTSWLGSLDEQEETPVETEAAVPVEEEAAESVSDDSLPDWLSGVDENVPAASASDDLPAWLRDDTGELVAEPTKIEPTRATDWSPVDEEKSEAVEPLPPAPEPEPTPKPVPVDKAVPSKKTAKPAVSESYKEPVTRKATGMLEMPVDPILESARTELTRSNIPGALDTYGKLIKKGRFLEEVIYDLRDALYRYPVEVSIWQSLGDAYMRANQLQDALDSYTKAEELLR
jgi:tetratricopeptide (TPR) repeat protein